MVCFSQTGALCTNRTSVFPFSMFCFTDFPPSFLYAIFMLGFRFRFAEFSGEYLAINQGFFVLHYSENRSYRFFSLIPKYDLNRATVFYIFEYFYSPISFFLVLFTTHPQRGDLWNRFLVPKKKKRDLGRAIPFHSIPASY